MKVTWSEFKALDDWLVEHSCQFGCFAETSSIMRRHSHPRPNVDIAAWNLFRSEKRMSAIATGASNFHRAAAAMRFSGVKRYCPTLAAVGSVGRPGRLIPTAFEAIRDLGE